MVPRQSTSISTPRFRALLRGIAEYDDRGIPPLPAVTRDVSGLGTALEAAGYSVDTHDGGRLSRARIFADVTEFLRAARPGDTLLIHLSGHGVHIGGVDYLVPTEALLRVTPLADVLVPIDHWVEEIKESSAGQVLFVIDAGREGFPDKTESGADQVLSVIDASQEGNPEKTGGRGSRRAWSTGRIQQVNRQKVAYVFACGPGQYSRFVRTEKESFSVFTRSFQQVVVDGGADRTLKDLIGAINELTGELLRRYGLPEQQAHIHTDSDPDHFRPLPRTGRRTGDGSSRWVDQTTGHQVWELVPPVHRHDRLRQSTLALVGHLSKLRKQAAQHLTRDPWQDPGFAARMSQRLEFLLTRVLAGISPAPSEELRLSPAEAALLAAGPFLHDVFWARRAAEAAAVDPADWSKREPVNAEWGNFRRFAQGYPRLSRRLQTHADDPEVTGQKVTGQIGWWLLHRWVRQRTALYPEAAITELLPPAVAEDPVAAQVFAPGRLAELLRSMRADPGFLSREDRPARLLSSQLIAAGSQWEQEVRERLVAYLLGVSRAMAIEATRLPEVLVEHMGIADSVSTQELHATIRDAHWEPRGGARVLRAECTHPAVEIALQSHVTFLDSLLAQIHQAATSDRSIHPLIALPTHAAADRIGPAQSPAGRAYHSAGVRFNLAEDRVQELLMGEQLYGDPALAIRELYQNALDACRYRRARAEYLSRTGREAPPWTGRITFAQGVDEQDRPFLDCTDNGIGMGIRELTNVFSQAGTRFVETPEFMEEQFEWAQLDPPVELHPNSRFGIGVLSYFMLADEITVDTCRFDRTGQPGQQLRVSIAGPGNLFRIHLLGPGTTAGTRVRLHLPRGTRAPSCVNLLKRILWVSEFQTEATDGNDSHTWLPEQLSTAAPLGSNDPMEADILAPAGKSSATCTVVPATGHQVWWCDTAGAILVDGIWLQQDVYGAVVDLRGPRAPRLSVNRTRILDDCTADVEDILGAAVGAAAALGSPIFTYEWLAQLTEHRQTIAELVFDAFARRKT